MFSSSTHHLQRKQPERYIQIHIFVVISESDNDNQKYASTNNKPYLVYSTAHQITYLFAIKIENV